MKEFIEHFKKRLTDLRISTKIMLFYFLLLMFSITVSSFLYQKIYSNIISDKVSEMSIQTLYSISANIDTMLENVNNYSKAIFSNDDLQNMLRYSKPYLDLNVQTRVNASLIKLMESIPIISSVYIFDNSGTKYAVDKAQIQELKIEEIFEAPWYKEVTDSKGFYVLRLNAGGIFKESSKGNFISLIRIINDIQSQQPIGILIVNIPENSFKNTYKSLVSKYETEIVLLDENNENIIKNYSSDKLSKDKILKIISGKESNSEVIELKKKEYLVSSLKMKHNWKAISVVPFGELSKESSIFGFVAFMVIILNSVLLFLGSIFISRLITTPVKNLLKSMKGIENGEFKMVEIKTGNDEFGKLRDGYNIMILEIQKLIRRMVEEQKIKRKAELDVLQAQIKPHFLYNTFDAISSLALTGRSAEVYTIMKALGSYYRTSLSKGSEVVTIAEEVEVVKNYLTIQKIRYGDIFTDSYDIDSSIEKMKILKLVLQPLVENALYHGIKPKAESGTIKITAKHYAGYVKMTVEDNGVGMEKEYIERIMGGRYDSDKTSFGLRGTIERLRIFYGVEDIFEIESELGSGTKVIITIPVEMGY